MNTDTFYAVTTSIFNLVLKFERQNSLFYEDLYHRYQLP